MSNHVYGQYDWKPGEPVPLDELRRLDRLASGFEQASVTGEGATGADGLQLVAHPPRPAFWARVASHVSGAEYTFTEVQDDGTGATSITWADVEGGLTGNAFEVNGTTDVAGGTLVWVVQSEANERWEFMGPVTSGGGGGGGTFSGVDAYISSVTTVADGTLTTLSWGNVNYDTDGYLGSLPSDTATIPATGKYLIVARVDWPNPGFGMVGTYRYLALAGTPNAWDRRSPINASSGDTTTSVTWMGLLAAGDTFVVKVEQDSGLSIDVHLSVPPRLSITKLG
jgi:hypothetical protein